MYIVTSEEVRELISMRDAIAVTREAFIAVSDKRVQQPRRLATDDGTVLSMVARVLPSADTVVKTVAVYPHNPSLSLPTIHSTVMWLNGTTGKPEALIEGATLTALRTGAASGVATDLLARRNASTLTIIGAGRQAPDQIRAICSVRNIECVRIVSLSENHSAALAEQMARELPAIRFHVATDAGAAASEADIVTCATTSQQPLFAYNDVKPGTHVNGIGAYTQDMCELPAELLKNAEVIAVDQLDAASTEAGDIMKAIEGGSIAKTDLVEIGSLLRSSYDRSEDGITVFKSVGIAAQDWMMAHLLMRRLSEGTAAQRTVAL